MADDDDDSSAASSPGRGVRRHRRQQTGYRRDRGSRSHGPSAMTTPQSGAKGTRPLPVATDAARRATMSFADRAPLSAPAAQRSKGQTSLTMEETNLLAYRERARRRFGSGSDRHRRPRALRPNSYGGGDSPVDAVARALPLTDGFEAHPYEDEAEEDKEEKTAGGRWSRRRNSSSGADSSGGGLVRSFSDSRIHDDDGDDASSGARASSPSLPDGTPKVSLQRSASDSRLSDAGLENRDLANRRMFWEMTRRYRFPLHRPTVRREFEDVSHLLRRRQDDRSARARHSSIDQLSRAFFGVTVDDLGQERRKKVINRRFELRIGGEGKNQLKRRIQFTPHTPIADISEVEEEESHLDTEEEHSLHSIHTPVSKHVRFVSKVEACPQTPNLHDTDEAADEVREAAAKAAAAVGSGEGEETKNRPRSRGSILKLTRETWEEAMHRVYRERLQINRKALKTMSKGAFLTRMTPRGLCVTEFVAVSAEGDEIAWGRNRKKVWNEITHKKQSFFSSFFGGGGSKVTLRYLADGSHVTYGAGTDTAFNKYLMQGGKPWLCFTVHFTDPEETLRLACNDSDQVKTWFSGVQSLIPLSHRYITTGLFFWQQARLRLIDKSRSERIYRKDLVEQMLADAVRARSESSAGGVMLSPTSAMIHRARAAARNGDGNGKEDAPHLDLPHLHGDDGGSADEDDED